MGDAMELQKVRYFLAVCEERSFIRAARRTGVSQPSLSEAIGRFENELGGALFVRAVPPEHETLPTALALALKPHFEQIALNVEQVEKIAKARGLGRLLITHRRSASGTNRKTFARSAPYRF